MTAGVREERDGLDSRSPRRSDVSVGLHSSRQLSFNTAMSPQRTSGRSVMETVHSKLHLHQSQLHRAKRT